MDQDTNWWFIVINYGPFILFVIFLIFLTRNKIRRSAVQAEASAKQLAELQRQTALLEDIRGKLENRS